MTSTGGLSLCGTVSKGRLAAKCLGPVEGKLKALNARFREPVVSLDTGAFGQDVGLGLKVE